MAPIRARGMMHVSQYGAAHRATLRPELKHALKITGVRLARWPVGKGACPSPLNPRVHMVESTYSYKLSSDLHTHAPSLTHTRASSDTYAQTYK